MKDQCESSFEMIEKLYEKHNEIAGKLGCAVAAIASENPTLYIECLETIGKVEEVAEKVFSYWEDLTKNAKWLKIGYRDLPFNKVEKGQLIFVGDRKYITTQPCPYDEIELVVREHDGKSKTQISFCKVGPKGKHTELKEWIFNDDKKEKKEEDQKGVCNVENAKGYFFVVILNSQSANYNFDYTIKLKGIKRLKTNVFKDVTVD